MTNQLQHQQRRAVDVRIPTIEKYAYCLCLHVKPTTIFIAVFKLIRALLSASILLNTEITVNEQVNEMGMDDRHKSTLVTVNIFARIVSASTSAVGIYAVISGRAALLMPLYALLLVEFFFALPAFYNRDLDPSLADGLADFKNHSGNGIQPYTRYSQMIFSTITMIVKIYFLCVIWKCYRYLRLIEIVTPIRLSEIYPHIHQNGSQYPPIVRVLSNGDSTDLGSGHNMAPPPYESVASNMKPPNYEEAMKSSSVTCHPSALNQQTVVFTHPSSEPQLQQLQQLQHLQQLQQLQQLQRQQTTITTQDTDNTQARSTIVENMLNGATPLENHESVSPNTTIEVPASNQQDRGVTNSVTAPAVEDINNGTGPNINVSKSPESNVTCDTR